MVCKVRRISDDRSVFVLKDIIKLPDVQIVDQPNTASFEVHYKSGPPHQTFSGHQEDTKSRWLREIGQYVSDPLALHEHTVDDLRIDPTQVKSDTDGEAFKLPPRIDAHEPDTVNPAEVAQDHYLPHPEKKPATQEISSTTTNTSSTHQKVVPQANKVENKSITASSIVEQKQTVQSTKIEQKQITETSKQVAVEAKVEEKQSKLVRSTAVHSQDQGPESPKTVPFEPKLDYIVTEPKSLNASSVSLNEKTIIDNKKPSAAQGNSQSTLSYAASHASADNKIALIAYNPRECTNDPGTKSPQDGDHSRDVCNRNNLTNTGFGQIGSDPPVYETIYRFNFGDRHQLGASGGGGGRPPPERSNLPDFLIPARLITYETSFEISIRKIRAASPPPRPKFIKKMLVHTESLERKTREFLTGSYDIGSSADNALKSARQKIRSLKSTIIKSDDDVRHAEDTIEKAKSGKFLHIFNPRLGVEKPLYEFVEVPSEEECADYQRSERGISEQSNNMAEYSSSRYSSRTSRKSSRKVEGKFCALRRYCVHTTI